MPEVQGGMTLHARDLALGLTRRGIDVTVVTRAVVPGLPREDRLGDLPVVRIGPSGLLKGRGWQAAWPLARFLATLLLWLRRHGDAFDAVLTIGVKTLPLAALLARRTAGGPAVLLRSESPVELAEAISAESLARMRPRRLAMLLARLAERPQHLLRRADGCIAISPEIAAQFAAVGVAKDRIAEIPNGIDTERFKPARPVERTALRERLGLPLDRPVVLFTGRLSRAKGLMTLLEAWREIVRDGEPAFLVLAGAGGQSHDDCEADLRALAAAPPLIGTVFLPGAVDNPEHWLQAADLFVFPSEYEGFGLSLVEAMAAGLPVVATPVGVAPELLADGAAGRLVPIGDAAALTQALGSLLARPEAWPVMGQAGRAAVTARYGMDTVCDRYVALLEEAVSRRKRLR